MNDNPYERFRNEELILRDELAVDRTILANERTVLAYFRGALTLVIAGATFAHFFEKGILPYIGIVFIPFGLVFGIFGFLRYRKMDKCIRVIRKSLSRNEADQKQVEQPGRGDAVTRAPHP